MKLAFVLGTSTGGTGRHVRMLAAGCAARGVRVEVFGPVQTDRDFGFEGSAQGVGFTDTTILCPDENHGLDLRHDVRSLRSRGVHFPLGHRGNPES